MSPHPMIRICIRATLRAPAPRLLPNLHNPTPACYRLFSSSQWRKEDPRMPGAGREIVDEFAVLREKYCTLHNTSIGLEPVTDIV